MLGMESANMLCPQYLVSFRVNDNMLISRKRITGSFCLSKCYFHANFYVVKLCYMKYPFDQIRFGSNNLFFASLVSVLGEPRKQMVRLL